MEHMKTPPSRYHSGGETVRAGPRDRKRFSEVLNCNVVEPPQVSAPYALLNWGYGTFDLAMRRRLQYAAHVRDGLGTWWEKFGCSTVDEMIQRFHDYPAKPTAQLPYVLPPAQYNPLR